jgi:hypothetical protein
MVIGEARRLYNREKPSKPIKGNPSVKEPKVKIKELLKYNVEFVCEVSSYVTIESGPRCSLDGSHYLYAWNRSIVAKEVQLPMEEIFRVVNRSVNIVES